MNRAQVLLVDDNQDHLEILSVILGQQYRVLSYLDAEEALAALRATRPDLLMLDIAMSPLDGLQCLEAIRAMPGYGDIPAVALTAYARDVERQAFLAAGFQAVVTKPILDHGELFATISALLTSVQPAPSHDAPRRAGSSASRPTAPAARFLTAPAKRGIIPGRGPDGSPIPGLPCVSDEDAG